MSSSILFALFFSVLERIVNLSWDQRLQGATRRDRQSMHSEILAVLMQFITITRVAEKSGYRRENHFK